VPHPKVKLSDNSGNEVGVTDNRLDVNAVLSSSDDINIGNVVLQNDLGSDILSSSAGNDTTPNLDSQLLLGTHALLSARLDNSTTLGITCEDSTHNALHVAISDGAGIAHVNASNQLEVSSNHAITGGADGVTVVSTAGDHVELASSTACKKVDIQAQTDNTGVIAVGFTGVDATIATGTGIILYPGDAYSLEISNLNLIYIDSTENGEGVRYTYFT
jgi:hypothetical protein